MGANWSGFESQLESGLRASQRVLDPVGRALEQAERALLQFRWPPSKL